MHASRFALSLIAVLALGVAGSLSSLRPAQAQDPWVEVRTVAQEFGEGLSAVNAGQVQAVCTPELWARYAPRFQGSPTAGSLGTFQLLNSTSHLNRNDYASLLLLCRHPDGVEDAVRITLKRVGVLAPRA